MDTSPIRGGAQRAVRLEGPQRLRMSTVPMREPRGDEVRVRVAHAGICGSDLHVYETGAYVPRFPVSPGHEVSGRIEATGPEATDLAVGTPVVLDSRVPCGDCDWCRAGEKQRCRRLGFLGEVCDGGFAETVLIPRAAVVPVPSGLPLRVAALAEPCAVAVHGVGRALAVSGGARTALVVGLGPLGVLVALVLQERGLRVAGVEADMFRRAAAEGVVTMPIRAAGAQAGESYDLVVDTAGYAGSVDACLEQARSGGTVLALALHRRSEVIAANGVVERELTLLGAHVFRDEMGVALALLAAQPERFAPLVTGEVPLEGVEEAYQSLLTGGSGQLKILVTPGAAGV